MIKIEYPKLTKEQKQAHKLVVAKEMEMWQQRLNDAGIDEQIIKMDFVNNKSQGMRSVQLTFKSTFLGMHNNKVHRWVAVQMANLGSYNINDFNGISYGNVLLSSGIKYSGREDWEIGCTIAKMLKNEYFIWLKKIDVAIARDIKWREQLDDNVKRLYNIRCLPDTYAKEIDVTYLAARYATNDRDVSDDITTIVNKYNEQIDRGLIVDSPHGKINYPKAHEFINYTLEEIRNISFRPLG